MNKHKLIKNQVKAKVIKNSGKATMKVYIKVNIKVSAMYSCL